MEEIAIAIKIGGWVILWLAAAVAIAVGWWALTRPVAPRENRRLSKAEAALLIERHLRGSRRRLRIVR